MSDKLLLTRGRYDTLKIVGTSLTQSKNGADQVRINLEHPDTGDYISDFLGFSTEAAFDFTVKRLKAYGWDAEARSYVFEELNGPNPLLGTFVGPVFIKEEEYPVGSGKFNTRIAGVGEYV